MDSGSHYNVGVQTQTVLEKKTCQVTVGQKLIKLSQFVQCI